MAFLNNCYTPASYSAKLSCIFAGINHCSDQISEYICNNHARIFGLTYKRATYTNGENATWSKIVTYQISQSDINIPLFYNLTDGIIDLPSVRDYVASKAAEADISESYINLYAQKITCLLNSTTTFNDRCIIQSWVSAPNTKIIVTGTDSSLSAYDICSIPPLHRMLFAYTNPTTMSLGEETILIRREHIILTDTGDGFKFTTAYKKEILKYNPNDPTCIATPLNLHASTSKTINTEATFRLLGSINC